jgi:insulin-like growth factor 2 mRNA-binding protein 1
LIVVSPACLLLSSSVHDVSSFNLERIITIKGSLENICKAESMISGKLRQSYESDLASIGQQAMMFPGLHPMALMSTLSGQGGYPSLPPPPPRGHGGSNPHHSQFNMYANAPTSPYQHHTSVPSVMAHHYPGSAGGQAGLTPSHAALTAGLNSMPPDFAKEVVFLYIPNTSVGAIIGTGGTTIRDMISSSGSQIKVGNMR